MTRTRLGGHFVMWLLFPGFIDLNTGTWNLLDWSAFSLSHTRHIHYLSKVMILVYTRNREMCFILAVT
jgi:hypothetical protein